MNTIQRYRLRETGDMLQPFYEGGDYVYVRHADHIAVVAALEAQLTEARKPLSDMKGRINAVLRIYLQGVSRHCATEDIVNLLASHTAPEPVEQPRSPANPRHIALDNGELPENVEQTLCDHDNCHEPIIEGPSGFWTHRAGHSCCGPNKFAKPPSEAVQDYVEERVAGILCLDLNQTIVRKVIAIAREGYYSAEQVEKAVQDEINYCQLAHKMPRAFVDDVLFRLASLAKEASK